MLGVEYLTHLESNNELPISVETPLFFSNSQVKKNCITANLIFYVVKTCRIIDTWLVFTGK